MFKQYRRKNIAEMRELLLEERTPQNLINKGISVSEPDSKLTLDEFQRGKVARNPKNIQDQWYVAYKYYIENFEEA
jgi:hypothetical protein